MKFKISSELTYDVLEPTTYIFNIQAIQTLHQNILEESIVISPNLVYDAFTLNDTGTRFLKLQVNYGTFTIAYDAIVDVTEKIIDEKSLFQQTSILQLDNEVLPYLSPSRHCESDKLLKFAQKEFGHYPIEYEKVQAINQWIFNNIDYVGGTTDSSTSACDTIISKQGVCKDFAHLGIALCRALDIPARYLTSYAANLFPPDIHACFEAYIAHQWIIFDATQLSKNNELVKIAHGKDASEVAVLSYFGKTNCTHMKVQCDII